VLLYDHLFGLPDLQLRVIDPASGLSTSTNLADREEVLDVEMVHSVAPSATIIVILVDFSKQSGSDSKVMAVLRALRYAIDHHLGDVISMSLSQGEHCFTPADLQTVHQVARAAWAEHITFVASSGDYGAIAKPCTGGPATAKEVGLPAADPLVMAVGGTSLTAAARTGSYVSETAWREAVLNWQVHYAASGGGFSHAARPGYQIGLAGSQKLRGVPDVAADADLMANLLFVAKEYGRPIVHSVGGTSAAAPLWAGVVALADQEAGKRLGFLNEAIYRIGRSPAYLQGFWDVTMGTNTQQIFDATGRLITVSGYQAGPGWDAVTGWGTPKAANLVPLLIQYDHADDGSTL
jgi:subtilase family serine protease